MTFFEPGELRKDNDPEKTKEVNRIYDILQEKPEELTRCEFAKRLEEVLLEDGGTFIDALVVGFPNGVKVVE